MNVQGVHVSIGIPLGDQRKAVNHLLNILVHLHAIIAIIQKYDACCTFSRRDLDNPDTS